MVCFAQVASSFEFGWAVDSSAVIDQINRCAGIKVKVRKQKLRALLPESGKYLLLSSSRDHYDFLDCDSRQLFLTQRSHVLGLDSDGGAEHLCGHFLVQDSGRQGYRLRQLKIDN